MSESTPFKNDAEVADCIRVLAESVKAAHSKLDNLVFVGILSNGFPLAERLSRQLSTESVQIPVGKLDVALYRDDLFSRGDFVTIRESDIPFSIEGKTLILIDDVLFHGRTIRAALNALLDFGRPDRIELGVLIDRGHRELPIHPNYVGCTHDVPHSERIQVQLLEVDGEDSITLHSQ